MDTSDQKFELWSAADAELVCKLLFVKAVRASWQSGLSASRLLLQDWLVMLLTYYNEARAREHGDDGVDLAFMQCQALRALPRLVYALSRSAVLSWQPPVGVTLPLNVRRQRARDTVLLTQLQLSSLPPAALRCAMCALFLNYSNNKF